MASVGRIGIFASQPSVGRILVDHAVHTSGRYAEEQSWSSQFLEVAQVIAPVGLGDDGYFQSFGFKHSSDDGSTERRMVHVRISTEDDDVKFVPSPQFSLFLGSRQPVGQLVFFQGVSLIVVFFSFFLFLFLFFFSFPFDIKKDELV